MVLKQRNSGSHYMVVTRKLFQTTELEAKIEVIDVKMIYAGRSAGLGGYRLMHAY